MLIDTKFMQRCIQLAQKGCGYTSPNPMVGAVIVYDGKIIGEGYHIKYGGPHAEVNAINKVKDKDLLKQSILYVSLEPCSHFGKTPPCANLIIESKIPRVIIGCLDPFEKVSGRGVEMLRQAGVEVRIGILQKECEELNKTFFCAQKMDKPYVYLKWAQSKDHFIDKNRNTPDYPAQKLSTDFTSILTHKLRAEVDAILVGTNTVFLDNPSLNTRLWKGKNPIRIFIDRSLKIPENYKIYQYENLYSNISTIVVTDISMKDVVANRFSTNGNGSKIEYIYIDFSETKVFLNVLLTELKNRNIHSLMVEGGNKLLNLFIEGNLWDEAWIETADIKLYEGVKSPKISGEIQEIKKWGTSFIVKFRKTTF